MSAMRQFGSNGWGADEAELIVKIHSSLIRQCSVINFPSIFVLPLLCSSPRAVLQSTPPRKWRFRSLLFFSLFSTVPRVYVFVRDYHQTMSLKVDAIKMPIDGRSINKQLRREQKNFFLRSRAKWNWMQFVRSFFLEISSATWPRHSARQSYLRGLSCRINCRNHSAVEGEKLKISHHELKCQTNAGGRAEMQAHVGAA